MVDRSSVRRVLTQSAISLAGLRTRKEIHEAATELIGGLLPSDEVLYTRIDLANGTAALMSGRDLVPDPELSTRLASSAHSHPAVASYLLPGDDRRPRRVSDLVGHRDWLRTPAYNEVFRSRSAVYQLSLVTELTATTGTGWVLTRSVRDFDDDEVEVAGDLLPHLIVMATLAAMRPPETTSTELTVRETTVLSMLAGGAAAGAIGHQLGVSEATVRKHLEHIYGKLGVHDRLSAVMRAVELGFLPPTSSRA